MRCSHSNNVPGMVFTKGFNLKLPLWQRTIFVDWHGVLCKDIFWFSILQNPKHPFYKPLASATKELFDRQPSVIRGWLEGQITAEQIVASLNVLPRNGYRRDYLIRRLYEDSRRMNVNRELLSALREFSHKCFIVIATDNMDCFVDQIAKKPEITGIVDAVICSSVVGVLKGEGPKKFFGPWLTSHSISFEQALLIDDDELNCQLFGACGGAAVQYRDTESTVREVRQWISRSLREGLSMSTAEK